MTLEQFCREACDTMRMLVDELESAGNLYLADNAEKINNPRAGDNETYNRPEAIYPINFLLTSSIVTHCVSLMEFHIPKILKLLIDPGDSKFQPYSDVKQMGNILDWTKQIVKEHSSKKVEFGDIVFCRLKAMIKVRNDLIHFGGYRSTRTSQDLIKQIPGIHVPDVGVLYFINFPVCRRLIDDIESFEIRLITSLQ